MDRVCSAESNFAMYNRLQDGDLIETGQKPILADISSYEIFFKACESVTNLQKKSPHLNYGGTYRMCETEAKDLGISPDTYIHIQALNARLAIIKNPTSRNKEAERLALLKNTIPEVLGDKPVEPVKLSTLVDNGLAMCSECSVLAQAYLERQGIESYLCSANLYQKHSDGITWEEHHFLVIHENNNMFVYDPLNTKETGRPRVMNTQMSKNEFMQKVNANETFVLDFAPQIEAENTRFDMADTHHLGYGIIKRANAGR